MKPASWALFLINILPLLREIARALFDKHGGDVELAKAELRRIRDHGKQLDNFQEAIAGRLAELKARTAAREAEKAGKP